MTRLLLAALLTPVIAQTAPSPNEQATPDFAHVRKYIQDHMAAESVPSLAIAVARDGKIIWEEGFGWAGRENRINATARTPYYLASVTKSLTGAALMLLQERGKLDLDHPVNDYLGAAKVHSPMWDASQAGSPRRHPHRGTYHLRARLRSQRFRLPRFHRNRHRPLRRPFLASRRSLRLLEPGLRNSRRRSGPCRGQELRRG